MTEKDYAPQKKESKKMIVNIPKKIPEIKATADNKKSKDVEQVVKGDNKLIENKISEQAGEANLDKIKTNEVDEIKKEEREKQPIVKKPVVKPEKFSEEKISRPQDPKEKEKRILRKTEAAINVKNLPISTKHSMAICKFIKGKKINDCIEYLEEVIRGKKAVPMKGEIPHRKGKMMSGRFPKKASENFIMLLKSLGANANANNLEEPIIYEAIANIGNRPYGRFGRTRKKRTHITIKVKERKIK